MCLYPKLILHKISLLKIKYIFPSGGKVHFLLKTKGWDFFSVWQWILKCGFIIFSHSYLLSMRNILNRKFISKSAWLRSHRITDKNTVNNWNSLPRIFRLLLINKFIRPINWSIMFIEHSIKDAGLSVLSLSSVLIVRLFSPWWFRKKERFSNSRT